jgi:hypothetical protein
MNLLNDTLGSGMVMTIVAIKGVLIHFSIII